jgi:hypothetical protein
VPQTHSARPRIGNHLDGYRALGILVMRVE